MGYYAEHSRGSVVKVTVNKRRFRRITLKTVLTAIEIVTPHGNKVLRSYQLPLEDLSASGLRYVSKFPIPVGTRLDLVFQLSDCRMNATVEVVRAFKNESGRYDIGCKFMNINRIDQDSIIKYITLSSVRDAQPSAFYSHQQGRGLANTPRSCGDCRCSDCGDKNTCRACYKLNCGKRYCRMHSSGRQNLRGR